MKFLKLTLKFIFIAVIASLFALTACEGPEGPVGPKGSDGATGAQGPAGPEGPAGQDGQNGQDGQDGQDGNANVKSYNFSLLTADYTNKIATISFPAITQDVYDNGVVLVYWKANLGWRLLPFTFITGTTARSVVSMYDVGELNIQVFSTMAGDNTVYNGDFRLVIIPGTAGKTVVNLDYSDYEAVARYYDLPLD